MPPSVHAELLPESPVSPSPCDQQSQQHQESQKDEDLKPCPPAWRRCFDSLHGWVIQPHTPHQHAFFWTGFALTVAAGALLFLWGLPKFVDHVLRPGIHYIRVNYSKPQVIGIALAGLALLPAVLVPTTPLVWLLAAVLGFWPALATVTIGTFLGMSIPFLLGKQLVQHRVNRWAYGKPRAEAMLITISEAGPFKVVLLMRQIVPYTWLNWAASVPDDVTYPKYILASVIGQIPHNSIDVYMGRSVTGMGDLLKGKHLTWVNILQYGLGVVAAIIIFILGWIYAKKAMALIEARARERSGKRDDGVLPTASDAAHQGYNIDVIVSKHPELVDHHLLPEQADLSSAAAPEGSADSQQVLVPQHSQSYDWAPPEGRMRSSGASSKRRLLPQAPNSSQQS